MNVGLIILAATFALVVIALIAFIVTLVGAARAKREHAMANSLPVASGTPSARPMDTSLDGLNLEVADDAPSAALLTPLQDSEWQPPEAPVSNEDLADVSLAARVADYEPAPDVPEPAFAVTQYEPWQVEEGAPIAVAEAPGVVKPVDVPEPAWTPPSVPEVRAASEAPPVRNEDIDEFSAEIAALLPTTEFRAVSGPEPAPLPAPEPAPLPAPEPADETLLWEGMLREQQPAARAVVPPAPAVPRPEVKVAASAPPEPVTQPTVTAPELGVRRERPRARVHGSEGIVTAPAVQVADDSAGRARDHAGVPELVLSAPVEMWFGDKRIGVKAGTATYERFRKYADALLGDLKASQSDAR